MRDYRLWSWCSRLVLAGAWLVLAVRVADNKLGVESMVSDPVFWVAFLVGLLAAVTNYRIRNVDQSRGGR